MTKYTFRTIVAPDEVRADFTILRDRLNSTDKELMQAFWNFAMSNITAIEDEVKHLKEQTALAKAAKREMKAAAKLKESTKAVKKPRKKTEAAKEEFVDDGSGDIECIVVDGTR